MTWDIFGAISAVGNAITGYFTHKTKVSQTPVQKEVQEVRKERDQQHEDVDKYIDGANPR